MEDDVSAREVEEVQFTSKRWFSVGYDEDEVDEFLDRCGDTLADQKRRIEAISAVLEKEALFSRDELILALRTALTAEVVDSVAAESDLVDVSFDPYRRATP